MFWSLTSQDFKIHLVDVYNVKSNSILAGVPVPPSSCAPCTSLAPKIPILPRGLQWMGSHWAIPENIHTIPQTASIFYSPPPQPDLWNFQNALSPHALVISKLSTSASVRIFHFFLQTLQNNQQSSQIYSLALILHPIISNDSTSVQWSWLQPESLQVIITPEILKIWTKQIVIKVSLLPLFNGCNLY